MVAPLQPSNQWLVELLQQALEGLGSIAPRPRVEGIGTGGGLRIGMTPAPGLQPVPAPPLGPDAEGRPDLSPESIAAINARPVAPPSPLAPSGSAAIPSLGAASAGGGTGSFTGGGGTVVNQDAARAAGLGPAPTPISAIGNPAADITGTGSGRLGEGQADELYSDPNIAMRLAFNRMGINPDQNYFAANVMKRYQGVLQPLFDLWAQSGGKTIDDIGEFLSAFTGGANVSDLVGGAIGQAANNPQLKEFLSMLGPDDFLKLQQATSREAPGMAAARSRMLSRRVTGRRVDDFNNPEQADIDAWMALMGR